MGSEVTPNATSNNFNYDLFDSNNRLAIKTNHFEVLHYSSLNSA